MKVAVAIWVSTALLHREHPEAQDFSVREIVERAQSVCGGYRPGLQIHASVHCVATKNPDPARFCMLTETKRGRRRLFRPGDPCHPHRTGGPAHPKPEDIPPQWLDLVEWYQTVYSAASTESRLVGEACPAPASADLFRANAELELLLRRQSEDSIMSRRRQRALLQLAALRPSPLSQDDLAWIAEDPDLLDSAS